MPDDDEIFARHLVEQLPVLRSLLERHIADYDELLSHVFFGEVSRWAVAACSSDTGASELTALLDLLAEGRRDGAPDTRDLIDQSFIENICGETSLAARLPRTLAQRYEEICGGAIPTPRSTRPEHK